MDASAVISEFDFLNCRGYIKARLFAAHVLLFRYLITKNQFGSRIFLDSMSKWS